MKKVLAAIGVTFGIAIFAQLIGVSFAAPFPTGVGGLGTSVTPASGTIPIGNGAGSYTPAQLTPGTNISITNASGSVTISAAGGGSISTSTPIANGQIIYGTGSATVGATSTLNYSNTSGLVTLQSLNGIEYAIDFNGADAGAQINNAEAALPSNGGTIYAPCSNGALNYATPIVLTKPTLLTGCGGTGFYASGGTTLVYTSSTGTGLTYNAAQYSSAGTGVSYLSLVGPAGVGQIGSSSWANNTTSTVGIELGGSSGATGVVLNGVQVSGWGKGVQIGNNAFRINIQDSVINKNGMNVYSPPATGAVGENNTIEHSVIADSNADSNHASSISQFCIYIQESGNVQWTIQDNSLDDCQVYSSQFGGTANIIRLIDNHLEDPNTGQGAYDFVQGLPGQNGGTGGFVFQSIGNDYMQDFTSGAKPEFVLNGADFFSTNDTVELNNNVGNAMQSFVTDQDANDIVSWTNLDQKFANTSPQAPAAITYVVGTSTPYSINGLVYGFSTDYSVTTSTFSIGNTLNLPSLTPGKLLALNGSGNVVTTGTPAGGVSTSTANTWSAIQSFNSISNNGNVTTTNETVSSTLALTNVTASGTLIYPVSVDSSGFLDVGPVIGNTPASGAANTQEFNIVEQNCPSNASTSNQSECDWSMSTVYPDGTRTFTDLNQENYPGFDGTGWFETATGPSSTADAFLYPYDVEMSNDGAGTTVQHHLLFQITPVNATGTWAGATFNLTGNTTVTGELTATQTSSLTGLNLSSLGSGKFLALDGNGNVVTTSTPASSANNATGTIDAGAFFNTTGTLASTTILYVPANFATGGCNGSSTMTDFGQCANSLYNSISSTASSVVIVAPSSGTGASSNYQTGIVFGNNGEYGTLQCSAGTKLNWGGSGSALTVDSASDHVFGQGAQGCSILGTTSAGATSTQIGATLGGGNAAEGTELDNMTFKNLETDLTFASNTWNVQVNNSTLGNSQKAILIPAGLGNFGEDLQFNHDSFEQDSAPNYMTLGTPKCFENDFQGYLEVSFEAGDLDNCQFAEVATSTNTQTFNFYGTWFENPGLTGYDWFSIATSTHTTVNLYGTPFLNDATAASSSPEVITNNGNVNAYGVSVSGATIANFVNLGSAGTLNIQNFDEQNTAITNTVGSAGGIFQNLIDDGSSNPVWEQSTNGLADITNEIELSKGPGNVVNSTIDEMASGNLSIINNYSSGNLSLGGNGTTTLVLQNGYEGYPTSTVSASNGATVVGSDHSGIINIGNQVSTTEMLTFSPAFNYIPSCEGTAGSTTVNIVRWTIPSTSSVKFVDTNQFQTSSIISYICNGNPN